MEIGWSGASGIELSGPVTLEVDSVDQDESREIVNGAQWHDLAYHLVRLLRHATVDCCR